MNESRSEFCLLDDVPQRPSDLSGEPRHIRVTRGEGFVVVTFVRIADSVLGEKKTTEIGEELLSLVGNNIVLDFENVDFLPAAAFEGKLVNLKRKVEAAGGMLGLYNLPVRVSAQFRINHLSEYFSIYSSQERAPSSASSDSLPLLRKVVASDDTP
jgi:anti-anti-sigma regulatory factor